MQAARLSLGAALCVAATASCGRSGLTEEFGGGKNTGASSVGANGEEVDGAVAGDGSDDDGNAAAGSEGGAGSDAIVLAGYVYAPVCLVVDATTVYWCEYGTGAGDGYLMSTKIGGGGKLFAVSFGGDDPWAAAVHNGVAYWTSYGSSGGDGSVKSAPIGGGFPTTLATVQTYPYSIVATDTDVYWTQRFDLDGTISDINLAHPDTIITMASSLRYPTEMTEGAGSLFWTSYLKNGGVYSLPESGSGGSFATIAEPLNLPFAITTDDKNLYFATRDALYQQALGGGPVKQIAPAAQYITGIASDGKTVYWADFYQNTITSVPVGGGAVTTIATDQGGARSVAVDAHNIYWIAYGDGTGNGTVIEKPK